jgi:pimeloyl-ACP methyl ester carboxylesterase
LGIIFGHQKLNNGRQQVMSEVDISYKGYCSPGTIIKQEYIDASQGVKLNVVTFTPSLTPHTPHPTTHPESHFLLPHTPHPTPHIVFLPGLASVIDNFRETLIALTKNHTVFYIETREKGSSVISGKAGFSIPAIASDLPVIIEKLSLQTGEYVLAGYSLGAAVIAAASGHIAAKPLAAVLIEPSGTFKWPWWLLPVARYGIGLYPLIKPFLKWYMKKFHINKDGDYEMYEINSRVLDQANPRKLASAVIAIADFEIWSYLKAIETPCLVLGVSHDKFHSHDEGSLIAKGIKDCEYIDVENNKRAHSAEVATIVDDFLNRKGLAEVIITTRGTPAYRQEK